MFGGFMMRSSVFAVLALGAALSPAQQATWKSDNAHSRVGFSVSHMVISEVEGRFTEFDATLTQENEDFSGSAVQATIKTASVTTGNDTRDKHLRSDDFFNAEKFPAITFKSSSVTKTGDKTYTIDGELTIRDVTKPVVLAAEVTGRLKDPWGKQRVAFRATTTVNRFDYGVKWSKSMDSGGLVAGEEVKIELVFEFVKQ
jgi:polyisoprenoid-binding protein YceI